MILLWVWKRCIGGFFDQWSVEKVVAMDPETCVNKRIAILT